MATENFEQRMESMRQEQAQSAARIRLIQEIIVDLARGTRDRFQVTDKRVDEKSEVTDKRLDDVDVKIAALVDAQIHTEESVKKMGEALRVLADAQIRTEESVKETQESAKKTDEALRALADAQIRTEESVKETQESAKKTDEALRALADAQIRTEESAKKTDEALRRLTALVDRYIRERRNGDSGASTNLQE
jgi:chromosome segregation ATPase